MEARGRTWKGQFTGVDGWSWRLPRSGWTWRLTPNGSTYVCTYLRYLGNVSMASTGGLPLQGTLPGPPLPFRMPRPLIGQFYPAITQNTIDQDKSKTGHLEEALPNLYFNSYRRCQYGYLCRHLPVLLFRSRLWSIIPKDEYLKRAAGQDIPGALALIIPWHKILNTNESKMQELARDGALA